MPPAFTIGTVLPHGPIEKLNGCLWRIEGSLGDIEDLVRIVVGHGSVIDERPGETLRTLAGRDL